MPIFLFSRTLTARTNTSSALAPHLRLVTIFKFIHAADIHSDRALKCRQQYEGAPVDEIRRAPREGLSNLVDLAIEQQVQFVLIAGDLYDGDWKNFQTGMYFVQQATRLRAAGIPLVFIAGNHDAANKMTRSLPLPDSVTLLSHKKPQTIHLEALDVAIHGQSFATECVLEDLSQAYPAAERGCLNIGLLHTSAEGREGHDRYSPCSLDGLKLKGYDYWALGHIHKREVLCQEPFVSFSGNIQGRHIRESGPKGCYVVTVHDDRRLEPVFHPLDVMRWETAEVDVSAVQHADDILGCVNEQLSQLMLGAEGKPLAVRVELVGTTKLHRELQAYQDHWVHQVRGLALDVGQGKLWIEKVKLHTSPPARSGTTASIDEAALGELTELFTQLRAQPQQLDALGFDFQPVVNKLPPELKSLVGAATKSGTLNFTQADDKDVPQADDWLADVLSQAEALLTHRLQHGTAESPP